MVAYSQIFCPSCGSPMVLRETRKITNKDGSPTKFYGCSRWPDCNETHGAAPDGSPLGIPVNQEVRTLRRELHALAEKIWDWNDKAQKKMMYRWMAQNTNSGHIAKMDKEELIILRTQLNALINQKKEGVFLE